MHLVTFVEMTNRSLSAHTPSKPMANVYCFDSLLTAEINIATLLLKVYPAKHVGMRYALLHSRP